MQYTSMQWTPLTEARDGPLPLPLLLEYIRAHVPAICALSCLMLRKIVFNVPQLSAHERKQSGFKVTAEIYHLYTYPTQETSLHRHQPLPKERKYGTEPRGELLPPQHCKYKTGGNWSLNSSVPSFDFPRSSHLQRHVSKSPSPT
jgi:hypothetical protein